MTIIHIDIPDDVLDRIENSIEGKNPTDKVRNYITSEFISRETLLAERKRIEIKLKRINELLQKNPFYTKDALTEPEKQFLNSSVEIVEKSRDYLFGQKELYNKQFKKRYTAKEFELLLYKFKDGRKIKIPLTNSPR